MFAVGCSTQVEDKNSGMSNQDKKELNSKSNNDAFEIMPPRFEDVQIINEDNNQDSIIKEKYYGLRICLRDVKLNLNLSNRPVTVDGETQTADPDGCIRWNHTIPMDYQTFKSCKTFEKTIKIGRNKTKVFKYAIDFVNDRITDLERSAGCTVRGEDTKKMSMDSPLLLDDITAKYGDELTYRLSDIRWRKYSAEISSCLFLRNNTDKAIKFQFLRLKMTNLENGDFSYASNPALRTNRKGCFVADIKLQYEQYRTSHWEKYQIDIEVLDGIDGRNGFTGMRTTSHMFLNPWEPRGKFGIGEYGRAPIEKELKNKYAKFHLDGVMIIQIGNDTKNMEVNDYLGLTVAKTYQIVMNPYVDREHRYTKEQVPIRRLVSKGRFKLSMVVLAPKEGDMLLTKENYQDFEFITGASKEVVVNNGVINEIMTIPFPMVEAPRLALRTKVIFKIEPVNDTGLRSTTVTGFFKARIPWIKTNVIQAPDLNLPNYVERIYDFGFKNEQTGENLKAEDFNLENIEETCLKKGKKEDVEDCLKGMKEILLTGYDEKTKGYNKYVKDMFSRLELQGAHAKKVPKNLSGKQIYSNHLRKFIPDIKIINKSDAARDYGIHFSRDDYDKVFLENQSIDAMSKNMVKQMCRFGVLHRSEYKYAAKNDVFKFLVKDCNKNPMRYFDVKSTRHVNKVESIGDSYTNGLGIHFGENQGVAFDKSVSVSDNTSRYQGVDAGVKVDMPFVSDIPIFGDNLPNVGWKAGTTISRNETIGTRDGLQKAESVGSDLGLAVEKFVVDLSVDFERCFMIISKDIPALKKGARNALKSPIDYLFGSEEEKKALFKEKYNWDMKFYICDEESKIEEYTEAWYFIQAKMDSSMMRDHDGVTERKILKVIRGTKNYNELLQALKNLKATTLYTNNIGHNTPDDELITAWGHLVEGGLPKSEAKGFLVDHVEGAFPGTIEGDGAITWQDRDENKVNRDIFYKEPPTLEHKDIDEFEETRWYEAPLHWF